MKRFINRLPLLLFILTLASLALMILVRIAAAGTKLLSTGSGMGKLVAGYYHPSVVVFAVVLVLFIIVIFTVRLKQYYRRKKDIAENEAFTPGETVEYPPGPLVYMDQIEADDAGAAEQFEAEAEKSETLQGGEAAETETDDGQEQDAEPAE